MSHGIAHTADWGYIGPLWLDIHTADAPIILEDETTEPPYTAF